MYCELSNVIVIKMEYNMVPFVDPWKILGLNHKKPSEITVPSEFS